MSLVFAHDWLTGMRGGEKVLSRIIELTGPADLLTLLHTPGACDRRIESCRIRTSPLGALPRVERYYRYLLPLMPAAVRALDGRGHDVVISTSHCVAKAVPRDPAAVHICYCFTPMRYVWDMADSYRAAMGAGGIALRLAGDSLRRFDRRSAGNVDHFMTTSHYVAARIARVWNRRADVVPPPIDVDYFTPDPSAGREDFYLCVGALAPYKRVDQAVEAFGRLGLPLRVIGSGQQLAALRANCPANVELLGYCDDATIRDHYRRCRALVFPGEEDFGLVPLEAAACGAPVIAYRGGGATETVRDIDDAAHDGPLDDARDRPTGLLYTPQTVDALVDAVRRFESLADRFDPSRLSRWAGRFSPARFREQFVASAEPVLRRRGIAPPWSSSTTS